MISLAAFLAERNAVFRDMTLEAATAFWFRVGNPPPVGPEVPLIAMHKARLQWLGATDAMLAESMEWLISRGYETTMEGAPPLTPQRRDAERALHGMPSLK